MARPKAKAASNKGSTSKSSTLKGQFSKGSSSKDVPSDDQSVLPIFRNVQIKNLSLPQGVTYFLQPLENGSFEIIDLQQSREMLASEGTGTEIMAVPGRRKRLEVGVESLSEMRVKLKGAIASSKLEIFRFMKLPLELRYEIYGYLLPAASYPEHSKKESLSIRLVNKAIYEETRDIFYGSKFYFGILTKRLQSRELRSTIAANIKHLSFEWAGTHASKKLITWFLKFPKLQTVEITATFRGHAFLNNNNKYQNDSATAAFCRLSGFDALVQLRGLDRVDFVYLPYRWSDWTTHIYGTKPSMGQAAVFGEFLSDLLMQPVPQPKLSAPNARAQRTPTKRQQRGNKDDVYYGEASGSEYED